MASWGVSGVVAAIMAGSVVPAQAVLYRCPAPFGEGTVITNLVKEADAPSRSCAPLALRASALDAPLRHDGPVRGRVPAELRSRVEPPRLSANAWRVPSEVQRARDDDRRTILQAELRKEEEDLSAARRRTAVTQGTEERRDASDTVTRHVENIQALQRELSRLP